MKNTLIIMVALAASTAFADWTWQGGSTITTDLWNTPSSWTNGNSGTPSTGPGTSGSGIWDPIIVSDASGSVTGIEGWKLNLTLSNSQLVITSKKLQKTTSLTLDADSSLSLTLIQGEGNVGGAKTIDTAGALSIDITTDVTSNNKGTWDVTLTGNGSLSFSGANNNPIGTLTLDLTKSNLFSGYSVIGNTYELVTVNVVTVTGRTTFDSVALADGSKLGGFDMTLSESELSASATNLGKYTISQGDGGVFITYVTATPEPTTATLSLLALAGLCARRRRK